MDNTRLSNLLFLSGLATVGLPGCGLGDDDSDSAASTSGSATDGGGTGGAETESGSASASASSTDATASATASATDTADPSTSGGDPTAGSEVCTQYASWVSDCDASNDYAVALSDCNQLVSYLTMESPACGAAYEELLACAMDLDCATLEQDDVPPECQAQSDAFEAACEFGGGSSGGSDETGG